MRPSDGGLAQAEADLLYQPLDADLTSIAGLSTTSYGRACLTLADEAAARTAWGLVIGTNVQAYDAGIASLVSADAAAGLPYVSAANVWTSLSLAADKGIYATGTGALATYNLSAFARTLLDDADAAAMQATLGITSAAITLDFGDGSDGAAVFNGTDAVTGFGLVGSVYTATTPQEFQWTDCTISNGVIVNPAGCPLLISGTLTMNGTCAIDSGGGDANQNAAGAQSSSLANARLYYGAAAGAGRTSAGAGSASGGLQTNAESVGGDGGAGGTSTNNGGASTALTQWTAAKGSLRSLHIRWQSCVMPIAFKALQGGGGGGGGGVSTLVGGTAGYSGGGGAGGGVVLVRARNLVGSATTAIRANGGAGATAAMSGGTTGGGGGGGAGGGGFVSCSFDTITGAVVFQANAGAAGNGHAVGAQAANGGAGGNGGRVWVAYRTKSTAITLSAALSNGGSAGAGGGSAGANGTIGTTVECDL